MFTSIYSGAVYGIEGKTVRVEADISDGFPTYSLVGYLASEVKEAKERVTAALKNSGYRMPAKKIIINLSPAGLRKQGTAYDLPIALAILGSLGIIEQNKLESVFAVGELGLDGNLRPVKGVLPLILMAQKQGYSVCIVPAQNVSEACLVKKSGKKFPKIIGVTNLESVCTYFSTGKVSVPGVSGYVDARYCSNYNYEKNALSSYTDFSEIIDQEPLKRAILVAVAGMHHLLMIGPPGCGKSMSAQAIRGILPPMNFDESLEVTQLYSVAGILDGYGTLVEQRPFRSPHHTTPLKAMTGGGAVAVPGEISLAHRGILFLDELAEFPPSILEILRQPMEEGKITINRLHGSVTYPAKFMFVGAMNPCKCGYYPDRSRCRCTPQEVYHYLHRISRPLWNRIDVCVEVHPPVQYQISNISVINNRKKQNLSEKKEKTRLCLDSVTMAEMIKNARHIQYDRFKNTDIYFNSEIPAVQMDQFCIVSPDCKDYVSELAVTLDLSMRGRHKLLKVARTIADLDGKETISIEHLDEAACYRMIEQSYWEF